MVEKEMGGRIERSLDMAGMIDVLTCRPKGSVSSKKYVILLTNE